MHVVDDVLGLDVKQALEVGQVRFEGPVCQQVLEIAGVRRHVGAAAPGQSEGVFEFRADRQKRGRRRDGQVQWLRGVAAAAADQTLAPVHDTRDGVVVACPYLAVVGEERVGDARQPLDRLGVVRGQRLVRYVAAGQHDRPAQTVEQQVVEWRVRQE